MTINEADRLKSNLTGKVYKVKMVKVKQVILESEDRSSQVLTNKETLELFYEKIEEGNNQTELTSSNHLAFSDNTSH
jgi:hypothetical protein